MRVILRQNYTLNSGSFLKKNFREPHRERGIKSVSICVYLWFVFKNLLRFYSPVGRDLGQINHSANKKPTQYCADFGFSKTPAGAGLSGHIRPGRPADP